VSECTRIDPPANSGLHLRTGFGYHLLVAKPNCIELPTGERIPILYEEIAAS
jgi:hypothetical protein